MPPWSARSRLDRRHDTRFAPVMDRRRGDPQARGQGPGKVPAIGTGLRAGGHPWSAARLMDLRRIADPGHRVSGKGLVPTAAQPQRIEGGGHRVVSAAGGEPGEGLDHHGLTIASPIDIGARLCRVVEQGQEAATAERAPVPAAIGAGCPEATGTRALLVGEDAQDPRGAPQRVQRRDAQADGGHHALVRVQDEGSSGIVEIARGRVATAHPLTSRMAFGSCTRRRRTCRSAWLQGPLKPKGTQSWNSLGS